MTEKKAESESRTGEDTPAQKARPARKGGLAAVQCEAEWEPPSWAEACDTDKRYQDFLDVTSNVNVHRYHKIMKDISADYRDRLIREIKVDQIEGDPKHTILTITLEAQQLRSNIVEHKSDAYKAKSALEDYIEKISNAMRASYPDLLNNLRNETMRKAAVDDLTSEARTKVSRLNQFIFFCDERIKDIDQEKWAVKAILDTMNVNQSMGGHV